MSATQTSPRSLPQNPSEEYLVLVALDATRSLNNGLPSVVCGWIDTLDLQAGERVVHAGCGTGYYTALMGHVVGDRGHVTAIEFDHELAARAKRNLMHLPRVEVVSGDASTYNAGEADGVLINAGATHPLPLWLDILKPRGRLLFPLIRWSNGSGPVGFGMMMRIERVEGGYAVKVIGSVGIFPCSGAIDEEADRLLSEAFAQVQWGTPVQGGLAEVQSLRRERHDADECCRLHGRDYCFSTRCVS